MLLTSFFGFSVELRLVVWISAYRVLTNSDPEGVISCIFIINFKNPNKNQVRMIKTRLISTFTVRDGENKTSDPQFYKIHWFAVVFILGS